MSMLLELRRLQPRWGPRTLLYWMRDHYPALPLPAPSTLGDFLKHEGFVAPRKRCSRPGVAQYRPGDSTPTQPNDRWTIDFKGDFRLGDGARCYPLTLRDAVSRMLLRIDAFSSTRAENVLRALREAFEEYGLPLELHSDTGTPFGSSGLARLGPVSVFVVKHGVRHIFSRPAKPQDNGGHERMHVDLKTATAFPPAYDFVDQQVLFDDFRGHFNFERPHHALDGKRPCTLWMPSPRRMLSSEPVPKYPAHWEMRTVERSGVLSWASERIFVTKALGGQTVGLEPVEDGVWRLHFFAMPIGFLVEGTEKSQVIGLDRP